MLPTLTSAAASGGTKRRRAKTSLDHVLAGAFFVEACGFCAACGQSV